MDQHVPQTFAITVVAKRAIPLTVWAHALKMLSTQTGSAMATVTTVHMFHLIMDTADQKALLSGSTVTNSIVTVVTVTAVIQLAHAVLALTAQS